MAMERAVSALVQSSEGSRAADVAVQYAGGDARLGEGRLCAEGRFHPGPVTITLR